MWGDCLSELWWGRWEGYSSAWVKVNVGWEVLNIEDSPTPAHPTPPYTQTPPLSSRSLSPASALCNDFSLVFGVWGRLSSGCQGGEVDCVAQPFIIQGVRYYISTVATCVTPAEFQLPELAFSTNDTLCFQSVSQYKSYFISLYRHPSFCMQIHSWKILS